MAESDIAGPGDNVRMFCFPGDWWDLRWSSLWAARGNVGFNCGSV